MEVLGGIVIGACLALLAAHLLFGARHPMRSAKAFDPDVYYVVGEKRFDWFYPSHGPAGYHPNCLGGHTLDGRCISAVYVFRGDDEAKASPQADR